MSTYYQDETITLHHGDSLKIAGTLESGSVDCIVTSPPYYGLRDYGVDGQYGSEETPAAYVNTMQELFSELRRVLADDGTLWLNLGDSYAGQGSSKARAASASAKPAENSASPLSPSMAASQSATASRSSSKSSGVIGIDPSSFKQGARNGNRRSRPQPVQGVRGKSLIGIPWRVAIALLDDGWILRNDVIWNKPNPMPDSATDRLAATHEHLFMFSKSPKYWFDLDPIRTEHRTDIESAKGKNPGDVWSIATQPFPGAHFAVFPQELARRCIVTGCKPGGTVLDPFSGSGTTGMVAQNNGRKYVGIDLSADYLRLSLETRLQNVALDFGGAA